MDKKLLHTQYCALLENGRDCEFVSSTEDPPFTGFCKLYNAHLGHAKLSFYFPKEALLYVRIDKCIQEEETA